MKEISFAKLLTQDRLSVDRPELIPTGAEEIVSLTQELFDSQFPTALNILYGIDARTWATVKGPTSGKIYMGFAERPSSIQNAHVLIHAAHDRFGRPIMKIGGTTLDSVGNRRATALKYGQGGLEEALFSILPAKGDISIPQAHLTSYSRGFDERDENPFALSALITDQMLKGISIDDNDHSGRLLRVARNNMDPQARFCLGGHDIAELATKGVQVMELADSVYINHNLPGNQWGLSFPNRI